MVAISPFIGPKHLHMRYMYEESELWFWVDILYLGAWTLWLRNTAISRADSRRPDYRTADFRKSHEVGLEPDLPPGWFTKKICNKGSLNKTMPSG